MNAEICINQLWKAKLSDQYEKAQKPVTVCSCRGQICEHVF